MENKDIRELLTKLNRKFTNHETSTVTVSLKLPYESFKKLSYIADHLGMTLDETGEMLLKDTIDKDYEFHKEVHDGR